jgi:putative restriction endonuclease
VVSALDAAHIRWHQAGGPDREDNGLALCVLHHKTFDPGAFTVTPEGVLLVSDQAHGTAGFQEALPSHHGRAVLAPQRPERCPEPAFLGGVVILDRRQGRHADRGRWLAFVP